MDDFAENTGWTSDLEYESNSSWFYELGEYPARNWIL